MRRLVRSRAYARTRAVTGALFIALGAAIVVRTLLMLGLDLREIPALVLGAALIVLGLLRVRDYATLRRTVR
ncbi:MAG: hypothetical protein JO060_09885 [Candidatus Eremiobacteraeota bacterium]|nr:hypothetical protein [Candidatus Eremiobacteraeota bacterium]MBV9648007.1 hypothetical protein [Candidatus Eremiobacteraeota bacterium]